MREQPWVVGALERHALDASSWVDVGRGWLRDPGQVYDALAAAVPWRQAALWRYDHPRLENRLSAAVRPTLAGPHPAVLETHKALRRHYGVELGGVGLSWYRDGRRITTNWPGMVAEYLRRTAVVDWSELEELSSR